jgi:hypothetical protein
VAVGSAIRFESHSIGTSLFSPDGQSYHGELKLKLHLVGEPVLRQVARQLTPDEIRSEFIQRLIEDMRETMRDAPGVGLAAPQIGSVSRCRFMSSSIPS